MDFHYLRLEEHLFNYLFFTWGQCCVETGKGQIKNSQKVGVSLLSKISLELSNFPFKIKIKPNLGRASCQSHSLYFLLYIFFFFCIIYFLCCCDKNAAHFLVIYSHVPRFTLKYNAPKGIFHNRAVEAILTPL